MSDCFQLILKLESRSWIVRSLIDFLGWKLYRIWLSGCRLVAVSEGVYRFWNFFNVPLHWHFGPCHFPRWCLLSFASDVISGFQWQQHPPLVSLPLMPITISFITVVFITVIFIAVLFINVVFTVFLVVVFIIIVFFIVVLFFILPLLPAHGKVLTIRNSVG